MALTTVKSNQIQSSVALAGSPTVATQSASDNSTKIATTAYVDTAVAANTDSLTEGSSNLYFTNTRAISAVTGSDLDMGGRKVLFGNLYNAEANLPSASTYHGMFAHVHGTGKAYFAHAGNWIKLLDESGSTTANLTEGSNLYFTNTRAISAVTGSDLDMGGRKVLFGNLYSAEGDLPSAATYHGMFAHVHGTGKGYFAHAGGWKKLLDESSSTTADLTEGSNLYYTDARADARITAASTSLNITSSTMTGDGSDTTLTLATTPSHENNTQVYIDGVYQPKSTYSVSGTTLTFSTAPPNSSAVEAMTVSNATISRNAMTGDNSDTTLTLAVAPSNENFTQVYIDGVYQPKSTYSVSGTTLTFSTAPPNSSAVEAITFSGSIDTALATMTGDGSDTTLTLSITPSSENLTQVYIDGVYQPKSTYSVSGTTLTFSTAPPNSTNVEVITLSAVTDSGAFNDFAIKTGNYTAVTRDQLIVVSGSAVTITLPSSPSAGNVVFIKNAGTATVTVARNGSKINSTADNGQLAADAGATLVYVNSTIGWKEL